MAWRRPTPDETARIADRDRHGALERMLDAYATRPEYVAGVRYPEERFFDERKPVIRDGNSGQMGDALGWTIVGQGLIEMNEPLLAAHGVSYDEVKEHEETHHWYPWLSEEEVRAKVMATRYRSAPNQQWWSEARYRATETRAPHPDDVNARLRSYFSNAVPALKHYLN